MDDPGQGRHKITSAQLYRVDEVLAIHRNIAAPTLMVEASDDSMTSRWLWPLCWSVSCISPA
jgi:hypothetical protein